MMNKNILFDVSEPNGTNNLLYSQNRTLYVDQFVDDLTLDERSFECFSPNDIKDVFDYYQPCKYNVELKTECDDVVFENFIFRNLSDFDDKQLIAQSKTLSILYEKKNENRNIEKCLKDNLCSLHNEVRKLELAYRTLALFFDNAAPILKDSLSLMNVNKVNRGDFDAEDTIDVIGEIESNYDRININNKYSLLVIPGYLGNSSIVRKWAEIANKYKVVIVTDFADCLSFNTLIEELNDANLHGNDACLSNVVMTCNYIIDSYSSDALEVNNELYLPASAALAGKISNMLEANNTCRISGFEHGSLTNAKGTRINLDEPEIALLSEFCVNPITHQNNQIYPTSNITLYCGEIAFLKDYYIVLACNHIVNVLQSIIFDFALLMFDKDDLSRSIEKFFNDYTGTDKLIENYKLNKVELDFNTHELIVQTILFIEGKELKIEVKSNSKGLTSTTIC